MIHEPVFLHDDEEIVGWNIIPTDQIYAKPIYHILDSQDPQNNNFRHKLLK